MTVYELWKVSPQAFMYLVERNESLEVTRREEYRGSGKSGELTVSRVTPALYSMVKHVLEVETLPVGEREHITTVGDLLKKDIDIDVYDDVCEELSIAFCGPLHLTVDGYAQFSGALDLPVEFFGDHAIVHVDGPGNSWRKRLEVALDLFESAAGYCTDDEYRRWFAVEEG